ncbi:MAG TPA: hypothetical protein VGX78_00085 [Pirellulales bacterium]|nr:hypothetical protein [Pirellulales bacterium]
MKETMMRKANARIAPKRVAGSSRFFPSIDPMVIDFWSVGPQCGAFFGQFTMVTRQGRRGYWGRKGRTRAISVDFDANMSEKGPASRKRRAQSDPQSAIRNRILPFPARVDKVNWGG